MTSSLRTSSVLSDFLSEMDLDALPGSRGRKMMEDKLRLYLWWKGKLSERKQEGRGLFGMPDSRKDKDSASTDVSEALRKKDRERQQRAANRRRVRGGVPAQTAPREHNNTGRADVLGEGTMREESEDIAAL